MDIGWMDKGMDGKENESEMEAHSNENMRIDKKKAE